MTEIWYVDKVRLEQVLADYLSISVNFPPHGGQLLVVASLTKDQLGQSVHIAHLELRHIAVIEERYLLLTLTIGPGDVCIAPMHKKYDGAGEKATTYTWRIWIRYADAESISVDEEVTLMDWGNSIVKEIIKDWDG